MSRANPTREERILWQQMQQDFEAFPDERLAKIRGFLEEEPGFLGREVGLELVNALDYARYSRNTFIGDVCRADERTREARARLVAANERIEELSADSRSRLRVIDDLRAQLFAESERHKTTRKALEQAIERGRLVPEDTQTEADIRAYGSACEVNQRLIVWNSRTDYAELAAYLKGKEAA